MRSILHISLYAPDSLIIYFRVFFAYVIKIKLLKDILEY